MPSGRTHDRITLWCLLAIIGLSYLLTAKGGLTLIVAGAFLFSGLMFGPDLDIYSVQFKRWGILRWIWLPYQKFLKHRSKLSHGLIIGTVLRLIYLFVCLYSSAVLGIAIAQLIFGFDWNWQDFAHNAVRLIIQDYPTEGIALVIGLELGAMSHSFSDAIGSALKRKKRLRNWESVISRKPRNVRPPESPSPVQRSRRKKEKR